MRELRHALGERLAAYRKLAGLSQAQLGRKLYSDRTSIVRVEQGARAKDAQFWQRADDVLGTDGVLLTAFHELEVAKAEYERQCRETEREQHLRQIASWQDTPVEIPTRIAAATGPERSSETASEPVDSLAVAPSQPVPSLNRLRRVVLGGRAESTREIPAVKVATIEAHRQYQMADYDAAARLLPNVLAQLTARPSDPQTVAVAYLASAKLATKLGDAGLAWVTADRALHAAMESGHAALVGLARYQVACALLRAGHVADAEQIAGLAAESVAATGSECRVSEVRSVRGALLLLLAVMAARSGDTAAARGYLGEAARLADQLGQDGNWLWTGFGPTNVAIHELAVCTGLGNAKQALVLGAVIDTDSLPAVLQGRRSQVHIELATAATSQRDDGLAVLHLLEAERVAKQSVSRNAAAAALLGTLLRRERQCATPGLRALAARTGVMA